MNFWSFHLFLQMCSYKPIYKIKNKTPVFFLFVWTVQSNNNHSICTNCNTNNGHLIHSNNKLNINHNNNCILMKPGLSCTTSSSSSSSSYMHPGINVLANNYAYHTTNLGTMLLQQQAHFGGLQTPKDANCSFSKQLHDPLDIERRV